MQPIKTTKGNPRRLGERLVLEPYTKEADARTFTGSLATASSPTAGWTTAGTKIRGFRWKRQRRTELILNKCGRVLAGVVAENATWRGNRVMVVVNSVMLSRLA
jgi:hypothetical protein